MRLEKSVAAVLVSAVVLSTVNSVQGSSSGGGGNQPYGGGAGGYYGQQQQQQQQQQQRDNWQRQPDLYQNDRSVPAQTDDNNYPPPLPPGWSEHVDPSSGRLYFFNSATGATTWERPVAMPEPPRESTPPESDEPSQYQSPEPDSSVEERKVEQEDFPKEDNDVAKDGDEVLYDEPAPESDPREPVKSEEENLLSTNDKNVLTHYRREGREVQSDAIEHRAEQGWQPDDRLHQERQNHPGWGFPEESSKQQYWDNSPGSRQGGYGSDRSSSGQTDKILRPLEGGERSPGWGLARQLEDRPSSARSGPEEARVADAQLNSERSSNTYRTDLNADSLSPTGESTPPKESFTKDTTQPHWGQHQLPQNEGSGAAIPKESLGSKLPQPGYLPEQPLMQKTMSPPPFGRSNPNNPIQETRPPLPAVGSSTSPDQEQRQRGPHGYPYSQYPPTSPQSPSKQYPDAQQGGPQEGPLHQQRPPAGQYYPQGRQQQVIPGQPQGQNPYGSQLGRPGYNSQQVHSPGGGQYGQPGNSAFPGGQYGQYGGQQYSGQPGNYASYQGYGQHQQASSQQLVELGPTTAVKEAIGTAWSSLIGLSNRTLEAVDTARTTVVSGAKEAGQTIGTTSASLWGQARNRLGSFFESSPDQSQYSLSGRYGLPSPPSVPGPGHQGYPSQQNPIPQQRSDYQQSQQGRFPPGYVPPRVRSDLPYPPQNQDRRQGSPPPLQQQWGPGAPGADPRQHGQYPPRPGQPVGPGQRYPPQQLVQPGQPGQQYPPRQWPGQSAAQQHQKQQQPPYPQTPQPQDGELKDPWQHPGLGPDGY